MTPQATERRSQHRSGFTLIELIVVIGIITIMATLAVSFVPRVQEKQKVTNAAGQVQGWLMVAKQWALRDQAPRGLRLIPNGSKVFTLQYIEQPDDYVIPSPASITATTAGAVTLTVAPTNPLDFAGGFAPGSQQCPVQLGDSIEIGTGAPSRLLPISAMTSATALTVIWDGGAAVTATSDFRIVRAARARVGEAPLNLPPTVVIDISTNGTYSMPLPTGPYGIDIMFAPSGTLIGSTLPPNDIKLWVRDTSEDTTPANPPVDIFRNQPLLVTITLRTGLIGVQPVDPTPGTPYSFTQDGRSSGF